MVDVVRSVSAARAIKTPTSVDVTDAQDAPISRPFLCFEIGDSLTRILRDLLSAFEGISCEAAAAVDGRFADGEARSKFHHSDCSRSEQSVPSASADGPGAQLASLVPSANADGTDFIGLLSYSFVAIRNAQTLTRIAPQVSRPANGQSPVSQSSDRERL